MYVLAFVTFKSPLTTERRHRFQTNFSFTSEKNKSSSLDEKQLKSHDKRLILGRVDPTAELEMDELPVKSMLAK